MADTLADLMFGPSHDDRPCGDCVACCVLTVIDTPGAELSAAVSQAFTATWNGRVLALAFADHGRALVIAGPAATGRRAR